MKLLETTKKADYGWFVLFAICTIGYSLVQESFRPGYSGTNQSLRYLLGFIPNFLSAIGLPALFMVLIPSLFSETRRFKLPHQNLHLLCLVISVSGLTLWEVLQLLMPNGYFDWHDLLWTYLGTSIFYLIWFLANSKSNRVHHSRSKDSQKITV